MGMIKNYFISAWRTLANDKLYTSINAIGLSIGLATCFLIYSWVKFETSYDKDFQNSDRVYRVVTKWKSSPEDGRATTYPMVRTRLLSQFPEIEVSTRLFDRGFLGSRTRIANNDKVFTDSKFFYADSTFFQVFPFHFIKGNATEALQKPNAVVLTEASAKKYFGSDDPVGKTITVGNGEFEVTAVIENIPLNRHFHFDLLASMQSHPWIKMAEENVWSGISFHTYARLRSGASADELKQKLSYLLDHFPNDPEGYGKNVNLQLQPVQSIHLHSAMGFELEPNGSSIYVYLFVSIAVLVMLMAIINYTNLTGARYTKRFKEVGVRKVMGASRKQLIAQFVTESMMITVAACVLAIIWIEMAKPLIATFSAQSYVFTSLLEPGLLFSLAFFVLLVGLITGISPAIALSAFQPARLFKANVSASSGGITVRKVLIVSQFTISIALTICMAVTYQQVKFLKEAKLGYKLDHTLVLNIGFKEVKGKYALLKKQFSNNQDILGATATSQLPTDIETEENIDITSSQSLGVHCVSVDPDFFTVMGIPVKHGEKLISSMNETNTLNQFVLNESALKAIGWAEQDAVNKQMSIRHGNQKRGPVKGVVSDFHFQSLHHSVEPLVLEFNPDEYQYLLVKLKNDHLPETIRFIEQRWNQLAMGIPFEYSFLDQEYNRLYRSEQQTSSLFMVFATMAIIISMLGLFGLSSFAVERRTKEIGIRKILGANNGTILTLISKDFLVLLMISFVLALPLGYYFKQQWLTGFASQASIGWWLFLLAGVANFAIAIITLLYQGVRIGATNPIDTLRYE